MAEGAAAPGALAPSAAVGPPPLDRLYPSVLRESDHRWGTLSATDGGALEDFADEDALMRLGAERLRAEVGPDHPDVAAALVALAEVYVAAAEYGKAAGTLVEAIGIYSRRSYTGSGTQAMAIAKAKELLGSTYLALNRPSDAERVLAEAAEMLDHHAGDVRAAGPAPAEATRGGKGEAPAHGAAGRRFAAASRAVSFGTRLSRALGVAASGAAALEPSTSTAHMSRPARPRSAANARAGPLHPPAWR